LAAAAKLEKRASFANNNESGTKDECTRTNRVGTDEILYTELNRSASHNIIQNSFWIEK
jgi:hypothetical protein